MPWLKLRVRSPYMGVNPDGRHVCLLHERVRSPYMGVNLDAGAAFTNVIEFVPRTWG